MSTDVLPCPAVQLLPPANDPVPHKVVPGIHSYDHNYRRYDLEIMEAFGQGVNDPSDPRRPVRWFDRDDLRERCASEIAFVRLPQEEQDAHTAEALNRAGDLLCSGRADESAQQ